MSRNLPNYLKKFPIRRYIFPECGQFEYAEEQEAPRIKETKTLIRVKQENSPLLEVKNPECQIELDNFSDRNACKFHV